jgi:hypothetical protein
MARPAHILSDDTYPFKLPTEALLVSASEAVFGATATLSGLAALFVALAFVSLSLPPHPAITTAVNPINSAFSVFNFI